MRGQNEAKREAFTLVPETCPEIDNALELIKIAVDAAETTIKEKTSELRGALIDSIDRALDAEESCDDLQRKVDRMHDRIIELEQELSEYK